MATTPLADKIRAMAENKIKGDAPELYRRIIGFQVLEKTEGKDGGPVILAVFGFRLGDKWAFSPLIFENGNLDGTELLWVRDWDRVLPARDNVVKGVESGSMDNWAYPTKPEVGVGNFFSDVRFTQLGSPKTYGMLKMSSQDEGGLAGSPVREFIAKMACWADEGLQKGPTAYAGMLMQGIEKRAADIAADLRGQESSRGGLRVIDDVADPVVSQLAEGEAKAFFRNGYFITDDRSLPNTRVVTRVNHGIEGYVSPSVPGIYQILDGTGTESKPCMVFPGVSRKINMFASDSTCPLDNWFAEFPDPERILQSGSSAIIIPLGGNTYGEYPASNLLTTRLDSQGLSNLPDDPLGLPASVASILKLAWDKDQEDSKKHDSCCCCGPCESSGDTRTLEEKKISAARYKDYLCLCSGESAPVLFEVREITKDEKGYKIEVRMTENEFTVGNGNCNPCTGSSYTEPGMILRFSAEAKRVMTVGNTLIVPESARLLIRDSGKFTPGSKETVYGLLFGKSAIPYMLDVSVAPGGNYRIEVEPAIPKDVDFGGRMETAKLDKKASTRKEAHLCLAIDCGIPAEDAATILNEAEQRARAKKGPAIYLFKSAQYAGSGTTTGYGPEAEVVGGLPNERVGNEARTPDNKGMLKKLSDILDTSGLETIAHMDDMSEFNKDLYKSFLNTTDDLGRKLAAIYWHKPQFEEQYGPELDDLITNVRQAFLKAGDFLFFLAERSPATGGDSVRSMMSREMATPSVN